jgi:hypothetical protein
MTQDEIELHLKKIVLQHLALRDVITWLLVREAGATTDPNATLRMLSEFGSHRTSSLPNDDVGSVTASEIVQQEIDWVVAAATRILEGFQKKPNH